MSLLTDVAASKSVTAPELLLTIVLFCAVYLLLFVAWIRLTKKFVQAGPSFPADAADDDVNVATAIINRLTGSSDGQATATASAASGTSSTPGGKRAGSKGGE